MNEQRVVLWSKCDLIYALVVFLFSVDHKKFVCFTKITFVCQNQL